MSARTVSIRKRIVAAAMFGMYHREMIHYSQSSLRMTDFRPPPNVPQNTDCSAYATWCYKSAGAPDPNGSNYNGYGYTGTQVQHGQALRSVSQLRQGDLIFYRGSASVPDHVVIFVGYGLCVSHGKEAGPLLQKITWDSPITGMRSYL